VPLVEAGHERGHENRVYGPNPGPPRAPAYLECSPPGTKQQDTECPVSDYVSSLSQDEMPGFELHWVQPEKKVEDWNKKSASVLSGKRARRFARDDPQPAKRRQPCPPYTALAAGVQRDENLVARDGGKYCRLLERIVGGFAGDDDIVHVALAQPGAADPHKAGLLVQFRNVGASAIAHA